MLKAVRDELSKGAGHIKLMVSGGVASAHDPLESLQFRVDEVEAACEANNCGDEVSAHGHTAEAVKRVVSAGVRTIEHGNMIDDSAGKMMAEKGAFLMPILVTYHSMARRGKLLGPPKQGRSKNEEVRTAGLRSLQLARQGGVEIGVGSDLLGPMHEELSRDFLIR